MVRTAPSCQHVLDNFETKLDKKKNIRGFLLNFILNDMIFSTILNQMKTKHAGSCTN